MSSSETGDVHETRKRLSHPASLGLAALASVAAIVTLNAVWAGDALIGSSFSVSASARAYAAELAVGQPLPVCQGGNRAARRVTCIVDGDTGWEEGVKWRLESVDTPEIESHECANELELGYQARDRLRELTGSGY